MTKFDEKLVWMLARANRRLEHELERELKPRGVPLEQFRALEALHQRGPMPMSELAEAAFVERSTMTKIVDRMVAAGHVFRAPDEEDRRRINIVPTDEGLALHDKLSAISVDLEERITRILDEPRTQTLRRLLASLA
ncbi:MarR family transcriptional regulator [Microbaculum marinum]|uniref:MarR family transcriptional regulator n=1 Tax=Microbaculum marinum TaxID=1764581 RepID=A0AAW9RJE8_9HYPH